MLQALVLFLSSSSVSVLQALEMREGDTMCLVRRAHCHLMLGNAESAFDDAEEALKQEEEGKTNIKVNSSLILFRVFCCSS